MLPHPYIYSAASPEMRRAAALGGQGKQKSARRWPAHEAQQRRIKRSLWAGTMHDRRVFLDRWDKVSSQLPWLSSGAARCCRADHGPISDHDLSNTPDNKKLRSGRTGSQRHRFFLFLRPAGCRAVCVVVQILQTQMVCNHNSTVLLGAAQASLAGKGT